MTNCTEHEVEEHVDDIEDAERERLRKLKGKAVAQDACHTEDAQEDENSDDS